MTINVGDSVVLKHGTEIGSLNSTALWEEGYRDEALPIKAIIDDNCWKIILPSGCSLEIHRGDIKEHRPL